MKTATKNQKALKRIRRHKRIRARLSGTGERPRLAVFKSNKFLYVQLIDDLKGSTIASASTKGMKGKTPMEKAISLGKKIAETAKTKKIEKVVFDRGGFIFTGKIKAVATAAREGGLVF